MNSGFWMIWVLTAKVCKRIILYQGHFLKSVHWVRNGAEHGMMSKQSRKELFVRWASLIGVLQQKWQIWHDCRCSAHTNTHGGWIKLTQATRIPSASLCNPNSMFNIVFLIILYIHCQMLTSVLIQHSRKKTKCTQMPDILLLFAV